MVSFEIIQDFSSLMKKNIRVRIRTQVLLATLTRPIGSFTQQLMTCKMLGLERETLVIKGLLAQEHDHFLAHQKFEDY